MKKITAFLFCLMLVIASVAIQTDSIYAATRTVTVVMPDGGGTFQVEAEEVAADAIERGSEVFNLGTGNPYSVLDMVKAVEES